MGKEAAGCSPGQGEHHANQQRKREDMYIFSNTKTISRKQISTILNFSAEGVSSTCSPFSEKVSGGAIDRTTQRRQYPKCVTINAPTRKYINFYLVSPPNFFPL